MIGSVLIKTHISSHHCAHKKISQNVHNLQDYANCLKKERAAWLRTRSERNVLRRDRAPVVLGYL